MEEYKPKEFNPAELTKMYVQTKIAVENKVNFPIFGPQKVNGIHRIFPLNKPVYENGQWFFITGTGLQRVNKDFFDVVINFYKENKDDFKYLVFSPEIKYLDHINYCEDIIVCHKSQIEKVGPVFNNTEELFNKMAEDVKKEGNDNVLHYYILPYEGC